MLGSEAALRYGIYGMQLRNEQQLKGIHVVSSGGAWFRCISWVSSVWNAKRKGEQLKRT